MNKEFEAEVKKVKRTGGKRKDQKDPDIDGATEERRPAKPQEQSPLKTPAGTPIIERQNG
jgi:hypothetical protein